MLRNSVLQSPLEDGGAGGAPAEWYSQTGRETPTSFDGMGGGAHHYGGQAMQSGNDEYDEEDNDDVPLLEELGVRPEAILNKIKVVLSPTTRVDFHLLDDADLAGPIAFCLLLGVCLLLGGNMNSLGYVYGFSVCGAVALNSVLNLMTQGIPLATTSSVLGYSLLPVIFLAAVSVVLSMRNLLGLLLSAAAISWSTFSAIRLLDAKLQLAETYWLILYPVALLYATFTLISVF